MKIIVSHDVDHIDSTDHVFKDLILEKMFLRSIYQVCTGKIAFRTFLYRITLLFHKRMNRIEEVMNFDKTHGIPSVFFFGMANTLGMSYSQKKAQKYILNVMERGFDVGVHGCNVDSYDKMKKEFDDFASNSGMMRFGIRTHYVRYEDDTFETFEKIGYLFDSSYYNKTKTELIDVYKIGEMWEFPLHIMSDYVCEQGALEKSLTETYRLIDEADKKGLKYCTILFHDYQYDDVFDPQRKTWYEKTIEYCEEHGYEFISYRDAIEELNHEQNGVC